MSTDTELLATCPLFRPLAERERATLAGVAEVVRFPAGRTIFVADEPGDHLYIVRTGRVEIVLVSATGREVLEIVGPGGVFGELALFAPGPRTAAAVAVEDLEGLRIGRAHLERFLLAHPTAALALLEVIGTRLRATDARLQRGTPGMPRWPAAIALLAVGLLFLVLPERYTVGPHWAVPVALAVLAIPLTWARRRGNVRLTHLLARGIAALLTLAVASSAILLLVRLTRGATPPLELLRDAGLIWLANIVTFAIWYWELDSGGPAMRHPGRHSSSDFAFPQQQQDDDGLVVGWSPGFLDYLFIAFNTSTAFSPTDTLVLSRRMKVLMMTQALISLIVVAVLAARAINTLGG